MTTNTSLAADTRFAFGDNWTRFAATIDERTVLAAEHSFSSLLTGISLTGGAMLDIGCGSGLMSFAARRFGMRVHAFDYDAAAVSCSLAVRDRFPDQRADWNIERGDVLDESYMQALGQFELVYAWGSLHHTGDLWRAMTNAVDHVKPGGRFFVAIYNDQGGTSHRWRAVKRLYHRLPAAIRPLLVAACVPVQWWKDVLKGALRGRPFEAWRNYAKERGMSPWYDMVDWVGGYPFEVAKPEEVLDFCRARGFTLERLKTVGGGLGCNEFVFRKT